MAARYFNCITGRTGHPGGCYQPLHCAQSLGIIRLAGTIAPGDSPAIFANHGLDVIYNQKPEAGNLKKTPEAETSMIEKLILCLN